MGAGVGVLTSERPFRAGQGGDTRSRNSWFTWQWEPRAQKPCSQVPGGPAPGTPGFRKQLEAGRPSADKSEVPETATTLDSAYGVLLGALHGLTRLISTPILSIHFQFPDGETKARKSPHKHL